jgi:DNA-binding MarR family transcriptional regulator
MIGALLRMPHEAVMSRMLTALEDAGFDLSPTELRAFLYPGPEGRRPAELARQCGMSRQAMNYVLAGLEQRRYIEPRTTSSHVVRLTPRGRQLVPTIRRCVATIEREWASHLGARRFQALKDTLTELSTWLGG